MENVTTKDVILDKKLQGYGYHEHDFVASQEITVTITLDEYRELVKEKATADIRIKEAENDKYERNQENDNLKKENAELKAELYELQKKTESFVAEEEAVEDGE